MDKDKIYTTLVLIITVIVIGLITYYFFTEPSDDNVLITGGNTVLQNNTTRNAINQTTTKKIPSLSKEKLAFRSVNDYTEFFDVRSLISKYYSYMNDTDKDKILSIYDNEFISQNNITSNNINDYLKSNYADINYIPTEMYAKGYNNLIYYYVNGEEQIYDLASEEMKEEINIKYIVIHDFQNDTFSIIPIQTESISEYAKSHSINNNKQVKKNKYNKFEASNITDEQIAKIYVSYFQLELYLNTEKAYNMLDQETYRKYTDYEDFVNHIDEINSHITPNFLSYAVNGNNGQRKYTIICLNDTRVEFWESSIMNFKVALK